VRQLLSIFIHLSDINHVAEISAWHGDESYEVDTVSNAFPQERMDEASPPGICEYHRKGHVDHCPVDSSLFLHSKGITSWSIVHLFVDVIDDHYLTSPSCISFDPSRLLKSLFPPCPTHRLLNQACIAPPTDMSLVVASGSGKRQDPFLSFIGCFMLDS
jgi:hypothetical protein